MNQKSKNILNFKEALEGTISISELEKETQEYFKDKPYLPSDNQITNEFSIRNDGEYTYYPIRNKRIDVYDWYMGTDFPFTVMPSYYNPNYKRPYESKETNLIDINDIFKQVDSLSYEELVNALKDTISNRLTYQEDLTFLHEIMCIVQNRKFTNARRTLPIGKLSERYGTGVKTSPFRQDFETYKKLNLDPQLDLQFTMKEATEVIMNKEADENKFTIEQTEDGYILKKIN